MKNKKSPEEGLLSQTGKALVALIAESKIKISEFYEETGISARTYQEFILKQKVQYGVLHHIYVQLRYGYIRTTVKPELEETYKKHFREFQKCYIRVFIHADDFDPRSRGNGRKYIKLADDEA